MLRVKEILDERGISVTQMAQDLGLARVTVSMQINSGNIRISTLKRIADYLNVPMSSLLKDYPMEITCPRCGRLIHEDEYEKKD